MGYHAYCDECLSCYLKNYREQNKELINAYHRVFRHKFEGKYLYKIVNKKTLDPIYIGSTTNIYNRHDVHFNSTPRGNFAKWCAYNGIDRSNYKMMVLDLSDYDIIDTGELLALEHELIYTSKDKLINKAMTNPLTLEEIDTLEYVYSRIPTHSLKWIEFQDLINCKKNTY